ncbi:MAG: MarR family transcriptional regulator [Bacteroidales bacterium]|nr:MarR family transcriptional regulator [Bacteroidales bacterium]
MYEQLKLDNQLCFRLYTASRLITQAYRPYLEPLGITYTQYLVLMVLWEKDNLLVSEISERLMLDTNTVTPLLQRMEHEDLLVRTRSVVDARQKLVSLTKKGRRLEEQAKEVPACMVAKLPFLGNDPTRIQAFIENLNGMIDMLKE